MVNENNKIFENHRVIDDIKYVIYNYYLNKNEKIDIFVSTGGNGSNNNEKVKQNECYITVNTLDENVIKKVVEDVINILKSNDYNNINLNITIITKNDTEKKEAEKLQAVHFNDERIRITVKESEMLRDKENKEEKQEKEEEIVDKFNEILKVNIVNMGNDAEKEKNVMRNSGFIKNGYFLKDVTPEEMLSTYKEILNDENMKQRINSMSPEEIANVVLDTIASKENKKTYNLIKSGNTNKETVGQVQAANSDGYVAKIDDDKEIIVNGAASLSDSGSIMTNNKGHIEYTSVDEKNAGVNEISVESKSSETYNYEDKQDNYYNNSRFEENKDNLTEEEKQKREELGNAEKELNNTNNYEKQHVKTLVRIPSWQKNIMDMVDLLILLF